MRPLAAAVALLVWNWIGVVPASGLWHGNERPRIPLYRLANPYWLIDKDGGVPDEKCLVGDPLAKNIDKSEFDPDLNQRHATGTLAPSIETVDSHFCKHGAIGMWLPRSDHRAGFSGPSQDGIAPSIA